MKEAHGLKFWLDQAKDVDPATVKLSAPVHVLIGEAHDAAAFATKYWRPEREPGSQRVLRPGLSSAVKARDRSPHALSAHTAADILSLADACQQAQSQYLLARHPTGGGPVERGHAVLDEITAALEYLFDDGVTDANDAALASLAAQHHEDLSNADGVAAALDDYASLAHEHRADLDGLGGFDVARIDEARALAREIRNAPAITGAAAPSDEARNALAARNRLLAVLMARVATVRSAARFVFRNHPTIAREASSAYERRTRAARRRAKSAPAQPATSGS